MYCDIDIMLGTFSLFLSLSIYILSASPTLIMTIYNCDVRVNFWFNYFLDYGSLNDCCNFFFWFKCFMYRCMYFRLYIELWVRGSLRVTCFFYYFKYMVYISSMCVWHDKWNQYTHLSACIINSIQMGTMKIIVFNRFLSKLITKLALL